MEREILDFEEEENKPPGNTRLKYIGIARLILSVQIVLNILQSFFFFFTYDFSGLSSMEANKGYELLGTVLIYSLFIYYQVTQGINEIKFSQLIYQNKGLKIFSVFVLGILLLQYLISFQNFALVSLFDVLYLLIVLLIIVVWVQDVSYVFKRKVKEKGLEA